MQLGRPLVMILPDPWPLALSADSLDIGNQNSPTPHVDSFSMPCLTSPDSPTLASETFPAFCRGLTPPTLIKPQGVGRSGRCLSRMGASYSALTAPSGPIVPSPTSVMGVDGTLFFTVKTLSLPGILAG